MIEQAAANASVELQALRTMLRQICAMPASTTGG
jgi:hypothetical protein